jgi:RimJ/RimL family protein N-acetyltransferase
MLKGALVGLRAVEQADLTQLLEWRNRPEFRRYFREYRELSSTNQQEWFEKAVRGDSQTRMFAIVELSSQRLLGACGLCYINWVDRNADFSIYLGADNLYIDEKYAVDAAKVMARYGFDELQMHRLWAEIYDFDEPKKKMFSTLGFKLDGRFRQTHFTEGKWCDSLFFSLLANERQEIDR